MQSFETTIGYFVLFLFGVGAIAFLCFCLWVIASFGEAALNSISRVISKTLSYPKYWRFYRVLFEHRKRLRELTPEEENKLSDFLSSLL